MLFALIIAASAAVSGAGSSEPPRRLREAAALAAGAPSVEKARAASDGARARKASARSQLGPSLFADAGFLSSNNPVTAFSLLLEQERFSAQKFFASDPNDPPYTKDWSGSVSAAWTADIFGSARAGARAAERSAEAADLSPGRARDAAVFEAIAAFSAARRAEDAVEILREREADAEKDFGIAEALAEEGVTTAADPARARAALAEVRAELAGRQADRDSARAALGVVIGSEAAARPLAPLPQALPSPPSGLPNGPMSRRWTAADAAGETERAATASRWPTLVVTGRYEVHAPTPGGKYGNSGTVFGGVRVPLFASGGIDARVAEARAAALWAQRRPGRRAARRKARSSAREPSSRRRPGSRRSSRRRPPPGRLARSSRRGTRKGPRVSPICSRRVPPSSPAQMGALGAAADRVVAEANLRLALGLPPEGDEG